MADNEALLADVAKRAGPDTAERLRNAQLDAQVMQNNVEQTGTLFNDEPDPSSYAKTPQAQAPVAPTPQPRVDTQGNPIPGTQYDTVDTSLQVANNDTADSIALKRESLEKRQALLEREGVLATEKAKESIEVLTQVEKDVVDRQGIYAQKKDAIDAEREKLIKQQQTDIAKFSSTQIDPNRFWNNASTERQIIMGIAIALGTNSSGENKALDVINKAIDRDIAIQKENIAIRKDSVTLNSGLLAQFNNQYNDIGQAETAYRATAMMRANNKLKEIATQFAGEAAQLKAQGASARLEGEAAKLITEAQKQSDNSIFGNLAQGQKVIYPKKAEDFRRSLYDPRKTSFAGKEVPMTREEKAKRFLDEDGFLGVALAGTETNIRQANDALADVSMATNILGDLVDAAASNNLKLPGVYREVALQNRDILVGRLKSFMVGPGVLTESDKEFIIGTLGNVAKRLTLEDWEMAKLQNLSNRMKDDLVGRLNTLKVRAAPWMEERYKVADGTGLAGGGAREVTNTGR